MADNYLEKRMDDYRNGGSSNTIRKHKLPKRRTVWVNGVTCQAHIDIVKALCNGGHLVICHNIAPDFSEACRKTLAKVTDSFAGECDALVSNGIIPSTSIGKGRLIITISSTDSPILSDNLPKNSFSNVNYIAYPDNNNGQNAARMVRFLVDADNDIMNNQRIEVL